MKLTKQTEAEILETYNDFWEVNLTGDLKGFASYMIDSFSIFGTANGEAFYGKEDAMNFYTATVDQLAGKVRLRNRDISLQEVDTDTVLVREQADVYALIQNEWTFYGYARISCILKHTGEGWKGVHQHASFPDHRTEEGQQIAAEKIEKENLELREAVKRRTAELEGKNRELEIETALERVRARTMAMQHSDELADASFVLDAQVRSLGIQTWGCAFNIYGDNESSEWFSSEAGALPTYKTPREDCFLRYYNAGQRGEQLFIEEFAGADCAAHYEYLCTLPIVGDALRGVIEAGGSFPERQIDHAAYFKYGYLLFITLEPAPDAHDIFIRFAKVFEQTYTRFLDLQKAEAQAREAQIEAALEKVRSRSLAMHHSDELEYVAASLFDRLAELGLYFDGALIFLFEKETRNIRLWVATNQLSVPVSIELPYDKYIENNTIIKDLWLAVESGEHILNKSYSGDTKNDYFRYVVKHNAPKVPEPIRQLQIETERWTFHGVAEQNSMLGFDSWSDHVATDEDIKILTRFSKVFEQAYIRFLDLQKAEAQAKEAKIEAALENVRSRSLAMHSSSEIKDVVKRVFEKMKELGFFHNNSVMIVLPKNGFDDVLHWTYNENFDTTEYYVPANEHPVNVGIREAWKNGEKTFEIKINKKEKDEFLRQIFTYTDYAKVPDEFKEYLYSTEAYSLFQVFEKHCALLVDTFTTVTYTENQKSIVKRFANVFEQAYIRFLDLQKAEAQAREAKTEAALEKVRSRAMAMHSSQELKEVALELRTQMALAEQHELEVCAIHLYDESPDYFESWAAIRPPRLEGKTVQVQEKFPKRGIKIVEEMMQQYQSGKKDYILVNEGEKVPEWLEQLKEKVPDGYEMVIQSLNGGRPEDSCAYWSIADFQGGALVMTTYIPPMEEARHLLRRFANVFELAYRRFVELKQAEAQAREARIEASLERVRSKAMAMHNSQDLSDTIHVFYSELQAFSITPRRCGVGLLDKESRSGELFTWNTIEQGDSLELVGRIILEGHPVLEKVYEGWITQTDYYPVLKGNEIKEYYKAIRQQMLLPDYAHDDVQYGYFFFFNEGGVYAWTQHEMKEAELQIYRRFTSVLNLTYKRYKDLQQAEILAEKAEQDLILLKEEKSRTENALAELQVTQKQLIHSEKMASLGELTAGIAHEIQNPLNFVNNFSEVSKELIDEMKAELDNGSITNAREIADDIISNLEKINHHGKRADAIVKGMLQHSRSSTGVKEPTDINALCDEYLRLSYHGLRAKDKTFNATMKTDFDPGVGKIEVMPQDLGRAVLNLLTNAFFAVNEKKKSHLAGVSAYNYEPIVSISTKRETDKIEIKVSDNGNGIPGKILDKIFQPFFTTKPTGQGTGLGLSLSYDIVTKGHGGELKVATNENEGTSFYIIIPTKTTM